MSILDYFESVDISKFNFSSKQKENRFAYYHLNKSIKYSQLGKYDIAIFGVCEERNTNNKGTALAPDKIREQFYCLNQYGKAKVVDLGNLKTGESLKDTYIAIRDIVYDLRLHNVVPIIIGGGQDLTYGIYLAYDKLDQLVNLVSIDSKFDLGYKKDDFDAESYLGQILLDKGKNILTPK